MSSCVPLVRFHSPYECLKAKLRVQPAKPDDSPQRRKQLFPTLLPTLKLCILFSFEPSVISLKVSMTHAKGRRSITATELSMNIKDEELQSIPDGKKRESWSEKLKVHQRLQPAKSHLMVPELTQDYLM